MTRIAEVLEPADTLRFLLRRETADLHEAVDSDLSTYDLASGDGYAEFLQRQAKVLLPAEAVLTRQPDFDSLPYAPDRLRRDALMRDINALGVMVPDSVPMSFLNAPETLIGVSYVLEGSRLGARVLLKRVAPECQATDFLRHGNSLPLWPTYLKWLRAQALDRVETQRAIEAARTVFRAYLGN